MSRPSELLSAIVCGVVLLHPPSAQAQSVGVEVGGSWTKPSLGGVDAMGDITASRKAGVLVGGYASIPIAGRFAIQPEIVFAQRHFGVDDRGEYTATEAWDFIEAPFLLRIDFQQRMYRATAPGLFILAGPAFSTRARFRETNLVSAEGYQRIPVDLNEVIRTRAINAIAALGVTLGRRFEMELRYDRGLRNLNTVPGLDPEDPDLSINQQSFAVVVHWSVR